MSAAVPFAAAREDEPGAGEVEQKLRERPAEKVKHPAAPSFGERFNDPRTAGNLVSEGQCLHDRTCLGGDAQSKGPNDERSKRQLLGEISLADCRAGPLARERYRQHAYQRPLPNCNVATATDSARP